MTTATQRIFGLDLWRAIAIVLVIVAHGLSATVPHGWMLWLAGGLPVDLFFVLSGYLIGRILIRLLDPVPSGAQLRHFFRRRWFRTLPNYYLFLAINFFIYGAMGGTEALTVSDIAQYLTFSVNLFDGFSKPFYLISWSLAIEEWFYLVFPGLVCLIFRLRRNFDWAFFIATLAMILLPLFARAIAFATPDQAHPGGDYAGWEHYRTIVIFRVDTIMCGVLAAYVHHRYPLQWERYRRYAFWAGVASLGVLLASFYFYMALGRLHDSFFFRTIYLSATSAAIAMLLPRASLVSSSESRLLTAIVTRVSAWSYLIYLSQEVVITILYPRFLGLVREDFAFEEAIWIVCMIASTFAISAVLYRRFEVPFAELGNVHEPSPGTTTNDASLRPRALVE